MPISISVDTVEEIRDAACPLVGAQTDYNSLLQFMASSRYVLLGEASHGTHEFYKARAEITKRLILEQGFTVVAWEADWPDALRVNRFIHGRGEDQSATEALVGFQRFPVWMWRNADILAVVGWLRNYNEKRPPGASTVGVYGLDLYSLHSSIQAVIQYLEQQGEQPKAIVWAHNSHLGDARAIQMKLRGELNVGQLVRERHTGQVFSLGFTTYTGTVTAASEWGAPAERKQVRPALDGSFEALFHEVGIKNFLLPLRSNRSVARKLRSPLLERAIGVIYRPETERWSHYFEARLADQFDAIIHFDQTRAVEPLERSADWEQGELPETYPSGF